MVSNCTCPLLLANSATGKYGKRGEVKHASS